MNCVKCGAPVVDGEKFYRACDWGVTDELVLADKVGTLPPELLDKIDWTRPWPKAFKFIP